MIYRLLRPLLFRLDAEVAHELANRGLRASSALLPKPRLAEGPLTIRAFGLTFPNPIGLAAGMDKGQALLPAWFWMGFGFVEIGTVTPRPQPGNPKPRLFRLPRDQSVINRMGFNNAGAQVVAARLSAQPRRPGPVGINLGKNKDTPLESAADDYVATFRALSPHADYATINVSSPNTPGLRSLQATEQLHALVSAVVRARDAMAQEAGGRRVPVLVKLSPDEPDDRLDAIADALTSSGADGLIATNTTLSREGVHPDARANEAGGLSGAPLRARAERACARLFVRTGGKLPLVGVGGISTPEDAYARIRAGASLLQVYTALIYQGPGLPKRLASGLAQLLARDGLTLAEAVGRDAERVAEGRLG